MVKVFLSIGIYVGLVLVLGFVLAAITPRESLEQDPNEDDL